MTQRQLLIERLVTDALRAGLSASPSNYNTFKRSGMENIDRWGCESGPLADEIDRIDNMRYVYGFNRVLKAAWKQFQLKDRHVKAAREYCRTIEDLKKLAEGENTI